jgi:hypothetical protein
MDYEKILRAYIRHVYDCEGSNFIERENFSVDGLSAEESAVLSTLANEIHPPIRWDKFYTPTPMPD